MRIWIQAARPKTLVASVVPVALASALAYHDGYFSLGLSSICLAFAILLQIGTNFANDYYDFIKGTDNGRRVGPMRMVSAGLITPAHMRLATLVVLLLAFLIGMILVIKVGLWLLPVGIVSILCAVAYTGGPYPLGYNGLGDVFVFIFFGLIAVMFTYYVQAMSFSVESFLLGCACGLLSCNILLVNNCRDCEEDARSGKRTTTVIFGRAFSRYQYLFSSVVILSVPVVLFLRGYDAYILLPLVLSPFALLLSVQLFTAIGKTYNAILGKTAGFMGLYGFLLCAGILLSK